MVMLTRKWERFFAALVTLMGLARLPEAWTAPLHREPEVEALPPTAQDDLAEAFEAEQVIMLPTKEITPPRSRL